MPALPCPLGARCHDGQDGATWKTVDVAFDHAKSLLDDHLKYAHQNCANCAATSQQGPVNMTGECENVNIVGSGGAQGGNFVNSSIHQSTFNLNTSSEESFSQKYQKETIIKGDVKGSFGATWKVQAVRGGEFVLQEITWKEGDVYFSTTTTELEKLRNCLHENVVCIIDEFYEKDKFLLIMEFCHGGSLREFIDEKQQLLPVDFVINWFKQLASGVSFIHEMDIVHSNLSPANVSLTSDNKLKIGNFSFRVHGMYTHRPADDLLPVYIAPEKRRYSYSTMADMWSLGVIVFEITTLKKPLPSRAFLQGRKAPLFKVCSTIATLVSGLLKIDPQRRMTAFQMVKILKQQQPVTGLSETEKLEDAGIAETLSKASPPLLCYDNRYLACFLT